MNFITRLFPVWALLFSLVAYLFPAWLVPLKSYIIPLLAVIMFGMGITLSLSDFRALARNPAKILIGVAIQFVVMPIVAFLLSIIFNLGPELTAGMILVGSSAGGTASNVICYLARGNVALSIAMTMVSTLFAVFLMPLLSWIFLHEMVAVPTLEMFLSVVKIVLVPVTIGVLINTLWHEHIKKFHSIFPLFSVIAIVFIIGIIVALNRDRFAAMGVSLLLAVALHNLIGMASGYGISHLLKYDVATKRTIAIEVGMQNSGLSVALAIAHFSGLAALPGAIFSMWHNISGSILASYWQGKRNVAAGS